MNDALKSCQTNKLVVKTSKKNSGTRSLKVLRFFTHLNMSPSLPISTPFLSALFLPFPPLYEIIKKNNHLKNTLPIFLLEACFIRSGMKSPHNLHSPRIDEGLYIYYSVTVKNIPGQEARSPEGTWDLGIILFSSVSCCLSSCKNNCYWDVIKCPSPSCSDSVEGRF